MSDYFRVSSEQWRREYMELLRLRDEVAALRATVKTLEEERQFWRDNYMRLTAGTMAGQLADSVVHTRRVVK